MGRGTPNSVHAGPLKIIFLCTIFFIIPPILLTLPLSPLGSGGDDSYALGCLVMGGWVWAISTLMASTVWTTIGFGLAINAALLVSPGGPLVPREALLQITTVFTLAALMGTRSLGKLDFIAAAVAVAALVQISKSSGLPALIIQGVALSEVFLGIISASLLTSPTILGQWAVDSLFNLLVYTVLLPGLSTALVVGALERDSIKVILAIIMAILLVCREVSPPLSMNLITSETSRGSRWLLAALLYTLKLATTASSPIIPSLLLLLSGASASLIITSLLSTTAFVWKPVRSTEFQMVTLDYVALWMYFVIPLCAITYKFWHEVPPLPLPQIDRPPLADFVATPIPLTALLILAFVSAQQAYQSSSTLWAHWIVPTYILGVVDTNQVALVVTLEELRSGVEEVEEVVEAVKKSGLVLNVFVSQEEVNQYKETLKKLRDNQVVLGIQTWAGALSLPSRASANVQGAYQALKSLIGPQPPLRWYHGLGGHRNPWALGCVDRLGLRHIAPTLCLPLASTTTTPSTLLDQAYKGGVVLLQVGGKGGSLESRLTQLASQLKSSGYTASPLEDVCTEVAKMVL